MNKILAFVFLTFTILTGCEKDAILSAQDLPVEITTYLNKHFPDNQVTLAKKQPRETDRFEVTLNNGFKLEFNKKYEVIDIDGTSKLPDSVVPAAILTYVNSKFPTSHIMGWEMQTRQQKVDLSNQLELIFSKDGNFLRIDD
ncbi:MAG: PepSY-like domain-containing protein [Bacteroidia bacterium]|jgi:hypothetical protein|nr:PepSY-like domain-containing protein [Bacteroidia bacterium]